MVNNIYIAGAHSRARTFYEYIKVLYPQTSVDAFLVDDLSDNDSEIDGIPVLCIDLMCETVYNTSVPVYLAVRSANYDNLTNKLSMIGFNNIIPVDISLDTSLRNQYVQKVFKVQGRDFLHIDNYNKKILSNNNGFNNKSISVYVASSVFDSKLNDFYEYKNYEKIIQVGTVLSDRKLTSAVFFDDTGDNISFKNKQYCELTALYWMWKNSTEDVVGLVHYRRHFVLPDNIWEIMEQECIDVILPVPLYVAPSIEENYKQRHDAVDWEAVMDYLHQHLPGDYICAKKVFGQGLYCPCNMFIARKNIADELCAWLFPILDAVVDTNGTKQDDYQNRYPGFLSERLITLFFEKNRDKYKIIYADKNFLKS